MEWIVSGLAVSLLVGVVSFFATKIMTIGRNCDEIYRIYTVVDSKGKPMVYRIDPETVEEIMEELREHMKDDEQHNRQLQSKLADIMMLLQAQDIKVEALTKAVIK